MVGYDPARFDYLFEPIGGDTKSAADGADDVLVPELRRSAPKRPWPWPAIAAATILGAGVALVALWSTPVDAVRSPPGGTSTTAPPMPITSTPEVVLPPMPSATSAPALTTPPEPTVDVAPSPVSVPPPVFVPPPSSAPAARPPSPTVRSPMSVSPAPRPAFPNQQVPGDGNRNRGGLLGLGGLL